MLNLLFACLAEFADLAFHVLDVCDLLIPLFRFLHLCLRAQGRSVQLSVDLVDLVQRLLISVGAVIVFFLRRVLCLVQLRFGVFGFAVFLEHSIHVDRADVELRLSHGGQKEQQ